MGRRALAQLLQDRGVTRREAEILEALAERLSNAEIAERLYIGRRTVESHVSSLLTKLGAENRSALAAIGRSITALEAHRQNLPVATSSFVGRERELERVGELLRTARLITLTGVGGAGKTRLALQAAAGAVDAFPDGVFFVGLAALSDPALVFPEVLAALGKAARLRESQGAGLDRLVEELRDRHLLLLLDNCEHLVDAVASFAETLLSRCPGIRILATSREVLAVPGELSWRVPSLSLPTPRAAMPQALASSDAVALFCERAQGAEPDFALTEENAVTVARICRRLDGIPLALELAAARLRMLPLDQIAERLGDRFRLLTRGARTAPARHQTLRAAMDWSYDLLSGPEQALLGRLSVFPGRFNLEAAEAVGGDKGGLAGSEVVDLLASLVDKSLVAPEEENRQARYRLLETVRQYAAEKLAERDEAEAAHRRHRDFFLLLAAEQGADPFWDLARITDISTDHHNLRAALEWSFTAGDADACLRLAAPLWGYWLMEGRLAEGSTWLERALAMPDESLGHVRVGAMNGLGALLREQGDPEKAQSLHEEALALSRTIGDLAGAAQAAVFLGILALQRGALEEAEHLLDEGRRGYEAAGASAGVGYCRCELGWTALAQGGRDRAITEFQGALQLGRQGRADDLIAHAAGALAPLVALSGQRGSPEALADEAVEAARRLGLRRLLVMALTRAAEVAVLLRRSGEAEGSLRECLALIRDLGATGFVAESLQVAAVVLSDRSRHEPATRLLGASESLRQSRDGKTGLQPVQAEVERARTGAAQAIGPESFAAEWARGRAMSAEEAVRFALEELSAGRGETAPGAT